LGRGLVEPLCVVDDAQQRLLLGSFGEEAEKREPDKKRARRLSGAEPGGDAECVTLRIRETFDELEKRQTELLQRRVVELHLSLDAGSTNNAKVLGRPDRVLEQRGLADSGLPMDYQDRAMAVPRRRQ
jgi:hypothetical protein